MTDKKKGKRINWATTTIARTPTSVKSLAFRKGERRCLEDGIMTFKEVKIIQNL